MIACLLPARNAEPDLPGWFQGVASLADAVVALDDGSTDATGRLLRSHELVRTVLESPPRPAYTGWDDYENRQRLLDAAAGLRPDWIVFLDSDERIDPDDAAALRAFLKRDGVRGCAYGLRLFRDWGDEGVDPRPSVVYRCFGWAPGLQLPRERLHFPPVPVSVPQGAWLPTTVRVRHLHSAARDAARRRKYAEADPANEWERGQPDPDREGPRVAWTPRPAGLPVLGPAAPRDDAFFAGRARPTLACLLPVRNGARDLPGYLESVAGFADAVLALDDGSTDETAALLAASPLVERVLSNPPRDSYAGWDDRANRQRLLDEARDRGFDWVLYLDADERIDGADGQALRELVDTVAEPGAAYGFRVHRMIGPGAYDRARLWVYRLFAAATPGDLPEPRLHLVPVPDSIPPERRLRTTIRIQHLASLDSERRAARAAKYREADPGGRYQASYANLLDPPGPARELRPRPEGYPLLAGATGQEVALDLESVEPGGPLLSVVVIARNDRDRIERAVRAVLEQRTAVPFETIVAASGDDGTADLVRSRFPEVTVVDVPEPGLPGMARNAGLAVARGEYVSFPGSHVELEPGSLQARIEAHELGWEMVCGSLVNGNETRAGWASYFLDASTSLPGRPSGPLAGAPARCSYAREILDEIGGFPEDVRAGEDTIVNKALARRGYAAYRSSEIRLVHRSPCTSLRKLVRHHFTRGRALGRIVRGRSPRPGPAFIPYALGYPWRRLRHTREGVRRWGGELAPEYRRVRALVVAGALAAWAGLAGELFRPRRAPDG